MSVSIEARMALIQSDMASLQLTLVEKPGHTTGERRRRRRRRRRRKPKKGKK